LNNQNFLKTNVFIFGYYQIIMKGDESEGDKEFVIDSTGTALTNEKITEHHLYDVIVSKKPEWQAIIYDLINSQQLDPWDIDLIVLTNKYFERIFQLEADPDFYVSSKVLLAAALLLRIKSELLLNRYIRSVDEVLFGKKEEKKIIVERISIDEGDLPLLIPKTPMARLRKITLNELMEALNKAISTETRRIKRELAVKRAHRLSQVDIPQFRRVDIKDRIKAFFVRVLRSMKEPHRAEKVSYASLTGLEKEQKIACFLPLLHLSNTKKLWLEQEKHLDDIWIYLYSHFEKNKEQFLGDVEQDIEEMKEELASSSDENLDAPKTALEKARERQLEKKNMEALAKQELEEELGIIETLAEEVVAVEETEKKDSEGNN